MQFFVLIYARVLWP